MPPDAARLEDVRAWLAKAQLDLKAATHDLTAGEAEGLFGDVLFHCQQAAEKALADRTAPLTEYAWRFRYPVTWMSRNGRTPKMRLPSRELYTAILQRVEPSARP